MILDENAMNAKRSRDVTGSSIDASTDTPDAPPPAYDSAEWPAESSSVAPQPASSSSMGTVLTAPQATEFKPVGSSPIPTTAVYHYVNSLTGARVDSLLPPHHPEMVCLQMGHDQQTRFGLLGILAAVLFFPLGIAFCLVDRRVRCVRCGEVIDSGVCG